MHPHSCVRARMGACGNQMGPRAEQPQPVTYEVGKMVGGNNTISQYARGLRALGARTRADLKVGKCCGSERNRDVRKARCTGLGFNPPADSPQGVRLRANVWRIIVCTPIQHLQLFCFLFGPEYMHPVRMQIHAGLSPGFKLGRNRFTAQPYLMHDFLDSRRLFGGSFYLRDPACYRQMGIVQRFEQRNPVAIVFTPPAPSNCAVRCCFVEGRIRKSQKFIIRLRWSAAGAYK